MRSKIIAMSLMMASSGLMASPQDVVVTESDFEEEKVYSPFVGRSYPDNVFFGDTHFHTNLSFDANLDRVQVIKGWLDKKDQLHEKIYDVALSGDRKAGADGRAREPVGTTVNIEKATFTNTIGAAVLSAHWVDPNFKASEHAFYYVRVVEIPTPRWTTYDAAFYGIEPPSTVSPTVQDRAYTSPIWYTP